MVGVACPADDDRIIRARPEEATEMFSSKVRITVTTLVASAGLVSRRWHPPLRGPGGTPSATRRGIAPEQNFTIGGKDPCGVIQSNCNNAYEGLLHAIETRALYLNGPVAALP
jgi:hypothetical protein